jgi:hypothetical protein
MLAIDGLHRFSSMVILHLMSQLSMVSPQAFKDAPPMHRVNKIATGLRSLGRSLGASGQKQYPKHDARTSSRFEFATRRTKFHFPPLSSIIHTYYSILTRSLYHLQLSRHPRILDESAGWPKTGMALLQVSLMNSQ